MRTSLKLLVVSCALGSLALALWACNAAKLAIGRDSDLPADDAAFDFATPIAHRGLFDASLGIPENSLAAFDAADHAGFGFELDIRLSADGVPYVFHDSDCSRMCSETRSIEELNSGEIDLLRLGGTYKKIPRLSDVAERGYRVPMLVELKTTRGNEEELCRATSSILSNVSSPYAVESFSTDAIAEYKRLSPETRCGLIALTADEAANASSSASVPIDFVALEVSRASAEDIRHLQNISDIPVLAWTLRDAKSAKQSLELGFSTYAFESFIPETR